MKIPEIDTVCFVGAGTMGCFNALMAAVAGYRAVIYDVSAEALEQAPQALNEMASFLVKEGFFQPDTIPDALTRIAINPNLSAAVANANLVSESVSERLEIKRDVHRTLDALCSRNTLITTNTSKLLVSDIEDVLIHGDRFAALHSHLGSVLIDIVGGPRTSPQTMDLLERYVLSIRGMPLVLKKENPGYVLNAILGPLLATSKVLVIEGIATPEAVDRAWMQNQDANIGPFGLMDLFGLNIIFDSWQEPRPKSAHIQDKVLNFIKPYIEKNLLGVKTGEGFYSYPQSRYQQSDFLDSTEDLSFIYNVLICAVIGNALLIAHDEIAAPIDIDRAWMASFSLAKGPFGTLDEIGIDTFWDTYSSFVEQGILQGESADQVEACLRPYIDNRHLGVKSGQGFYGYPDPVFRAPDFIVKR
ncbi:MAG: 3-hydroxyacyl-CoA dehydrogenase NAD-binding domain-containing protein [Halioglobus sp.]